MQNGLCNPHYSPRSRLLNLLAEKGQKEELTGVQRKYAYGLTTRYLSKDHYELRFLDNKKQAFELMKGTDQQFHVYAQINGKRAILTRIYLQLHDGPLFSPHIEYVLIGGIGPDSGESVAEKKQLQREHPAYGPVWLLSTSRNHRVG